MFPYLIAGHMHGTIHWELHTVYLLWCISHLCKLFSCQSLIIEEVYISFNIMQCNRTRSLDLFFSTVTQATPPVLGLLGCGCSVASEPVAEIIHHWNISQVHIIIMIRC